LALLRFIARDFAPYAFGLAVRLALLTLLALGQIRRLLITVSIGDGHDREYYL
jgi:hypothetical protein